MLLPLLRRAGLLLVLLATAVSLPAQVPGAAATPRLPRLAVVAAAGSLPASTWLEAAAALSQTLQVDVYSFKGEELKAAATADFAGYDLVLVEQSDSAWARAPAALAAVRRVPRLAVLTPQLFAGNVDLRPYPALGQYVKKGGLDNATRLLQAVGHQLLGLPLPVLPPLAQPTVAFYHPDAPGLFYSLAAYQRWYAARPAGPRHQAYHADSLRVGILFSNRDYNDHNLAYVDSMVRRVEAQGHHAYPALRVGNSRVDTLLQLKGRTQVDVIILATNSFRFPNRADGLAQLRRLDVPVLSAVTHSEYSPAQWEKSLDGLTSKGDNNLTNMFREGIFEPMVVSGVVRTATGRKVQQVIPYQLNWRVDRALAWARLGRLSNARKRLVATFYSEDGGKANVGTPPGAYLNAPASLAKLLAAMKERGYDVGTAPLPTAAELGRRMAEEASNVGKWAPGEIRRRVKNGNVILIPEATYLAWFRELPAAKQAEMTAKWGPPPGRVMVYTDAQGQRSLVIPRLAFGKVLLVPNPDWGYFQNERMLYSNDPLPPHHQYYALHCWMQQQYRPHAWFSVFNNLEVMAHQQVGPSKKDWLGLMTGDFPNIAPKALMTGEPGKEIMSELPVGYLNTIVPAGLNPGLSELRLQLDQLNQFVGPDMRRELEHSIRAESQRLRLAPALNVSPDTVRFAVLRAHLASYLADIDRANMPLGSHVLGEVPEGPVQVAMIRAMLGPEFEEQVRRLGPTPGPEPAAVSAATRDSTDRAGRLLRAVLLAQVPPAQALAAGAGAATDSARAAVARQLALALDYQGRIEASRQELPELLRAFEGRYIMPGPTGDALRNPESLPSGRNPYGYDEETFPTREAWALGQRLADQTIAQHRAKHGGAYPRKIGFILWASELVRNHGITEAEVLYVMGARPVWDSKSRVVGVELIPSAELQRPRIDVVATTSGDFRDNFQDKVQLIEQATRLVAALDEPGNEVRDLTLAYRTQLRAQGSTEAQAAELSTVRVFSPALNTYATALQNVTKANDTWKDDKKLSDLYVSRMGHAYGEKTQGTYQRELFVTNLQTVDAGVFSRSSNVSGLFDGVPEAAAFVGGLQLAVRNSTAERRNVDMYINNVRDPKNSQAETLGKFAHQELQERAFNPAWLKGMVADGQNGAHYMQNIAENMWAWDVTSPALITNQDWHELNEVYIRDKYQLGLPAFFEQANPYAKQTILSTMLGAAEKGYWQASEQELAGVAQALAESVAKNGAGCSSVICNTLTIQQFAVARLASVPGGARLARQYQQVINDVRNSGAPPAALAVAAPSAGQGRPLARAGAAAPGRSAAAVPVPAPPPIVGQEIKEVMQKLLSPTPAANGQSAGLAVALLGLLGLLGLGWWRQGRMA